MQPYPDRSFRMGQILRAVALTWKRMDEKDKGAVRKAVVRVLAQLQDTGHVLVTPAVGRGGYALYRWNPEK